MMFKNLCVATTLFMTAGLAIPFGTAEAQTSSPVLYNGLWRGAVDVEARDASSLTAFQAHRAQLLDDWQLFDFEAAEGRWTGLWRPHDDPNEADRLLLDIPATSLSTVQIAERADGFELVDLEISVSGGAVLVSGVWHPGTPRAVVHLDLSLFDIHSLIASYETIGYSALDLEPYVEPSTLQVRWAAVWVEEDLGTSVHTAAPGSVEANTLISSGKHPVDLETYIDPFNLHRTAGLWRTMPELDSHLGRVSWSAVVNRSNLFAAEGAAGGAHVWQPLMNLIDLDIESPPAPGP